MGPPLTTKLPDLVRDSELETTLSGVNTVHIYYDRPGRHAEPRREVWKRRDLINSGGNGVIWLEERLTASPEEGNQAQHRAVKQITSAQPRSMLEICKYELEALAKFSAKKYTRCFVESFGWYENSGSLFIAMEYCPLGDLQRLLVKHNRTLETDTREIIGQVVQGLQFMHEEGFAHRDLKPSNVLVMSRPPKGWWVKICDMGLSKRIEEAGAPTTAVKGTPGFFAPEQLGFGGTDPKMADPFKTDIWCLGEMTFRMLCGEAAFPSYNDLQRYHEGSIMFPKERLYKMEVSGPAVSFITSAMLAEPQSRLDAQQAFNHEWLMNVNNDPAAGQKDLSHSVLGPSYSEPNRDTYLGVEPSGAWSTVSLPLHPSRTEETVRLSSVDERQHNEVAPGPPLSHPVVGCAGDIETPQNSRKIRQTHSLQEIKPAIDTENRSYSPRSRSKTDSQYRTSRNDESSSITRRNRKESRSPSPTTTTVARPSTIYLDLKPEDPKEESNSDRSIESMQKLIEIENYFYYNLQSRSRNYLDGVLSSKERITEYRWLSTVAVCDILLKADEIESQGNEKIRARRKALVDQVNVMLDKLESARKRFDEQDKEQQGAAKLRLQSQHGSAREERQKERKDTDAKKPRHMPIFEDTSDSSDSSDHDVIYKPKPDKKKSRSGRKSRDIDPSSTSDYARKYSSNMEEAIRYLNKTGARPGRHTSRNLQTGASRHD